MAADRLRRRFGGLVARPWFDAVALYSLHRWYFPLSRLWGAARAAGGDADAFWTAAGIAPSRRDDRRLRGALDRFECARAAARAADGAWERAYFGPDDVAAAALRAAEADRLGRRHAYNLTRRQFRFLARRPPVRAFRLATPGPAEVEARHGARLARPSTAFPVPDPMPAIEVSRRLPVAAGVQYWLRFRAPAGAAGDMVHARVLEPADARDPPTVLHGHGVCVEFDHWQGLDDEAEALAGLGFRVVRPEAPWHGRRVPPGEFGGERFIATAPLGPLDHYAAALPEWGVLMDWCRRNTGAAVAMAGTSLGALTAQLAADRARDWPARLRPDALFLVTHCASHAETLVGGRLAEVCGLRAAAAAHGWTDAALARIMPLLDPSGPPPIDPARIVSVLGRRDTVTPYPGGAALVDGWDLPAENRFDWNLGHFSSALNLVRDRRPLERLRAVAAAAP